MSEATTYTKEQYDNLKVKAQQGIDQLKAKLAEATKTIEDKTKALSDKDEQMSQFNVKAKSKIEKLTEVNAGLEKELQEIKDKVKDKIQLHTQLMEDAIKERDELKKKTDNSEKYEHEIESLKEFVTELKESLDKKTAELEKEKKVAKAAPVDDKAVKAAADKLKSKDEEIAALKKQIADLHADKEKDKKAHKAEAADLEKQMMEQQKIKDTIVKQMTSSAEEGERLRKKIADLEKSRDEALRSHAEELEKRTKASAKIQLEANNKVVDMEKKVADLEEKVKATEAKNDILKRRYIDENEAIKQSAQSDITAAREQASREVTASKDQLFSIQAKLTSTEEQLEKQKEEEAAYRQSVEVEMEKMNQKRKHAKNEMITLAKQAEMEKAAVNEASNTVTVVQLPRLNELCKLVADINNAICDSIETIKPGASKRRDVPSSALELSSRRKSNSNDPKPLSALMVQVVDELSNLQNDLKKLNSDLELLASFKTSQVNLCLRSCRKWFADCWTSFKYSMLSDEDESPTPRSPMNALTEKSGENGEKSSSSGGPAAAKQSKKSTVVDESRIQDHVLPVKPIKKSTPGAVGAKLVEGGNSKPQSTGSTGRRTAGDNRETTEPSSMSGLTNLLITLLFYIIGIPPVISSKHVSLIPTLLSWTKFFCFVPINIVSVSIRLPLDITRLTFKFLKVLIFGMDSPRAQLVSHHTTLAEVDFDAHKGEVGAPLDSHSTNDIHIRGAHSSDVVGSYSTHRQASLGSSGVDGSISASDTVPTSIGGGGDGSTITSEPASKAKSISIFSSDAPGATPESMSSLYGTRRASDEDTFDANSYRRTYSESTEDGMEGRPISRRPFFVNGQSVEASRYNPISTDNMGTLRPPRRGLASRFSNSIAAASPASAESGYSTTSTPSTRAAVFEGLHRVDALTSLASAQAVNLKVQSFVTSLYHIMLAYQCAELYGYQRVSAHFDEILPASLISYAGIIPLVLTARLVIMLVFRNDFPINTAVLAASTYLSGMLLGIYVLAIIYNSKDLHASDVSMPTLLHQVSIKIVAALSK